MSILKDARQKAGCDTEEYWFYQKDRELIAKLKRRERKLKLVKGGRSPTSEELATSEQDSQEFTGRSTKKAA